MLRTVKKKGNEKKLQFRTICGSELYFDPDLGSPDNPQKEKNCKRKESDKEC
jgi:hypothetical protein